MYPWFGTRLYIFLYLNSPLKIHMGYSKAPTDKDTMLISDRVVYNPASLFHVL